MKKFVLKNRKNLLRVLAVILVLYLPFHNWMWPRYLQWFHARQESAIFNEKISGKMLRISMPMSPRLHRKITVWVYLPPGYNRLRERFPVVYALHGMPGEVRDVFVKGRIHDSAEALFKARQVRPFLLVSFDGHGPDSPADVTNFVDRADGSWPMESFMVHELVPWIDAKFRTIRNPQARTLDGVSAGGYAAFNLVLRHPDVWAIGASHTGFFSPHDDTKNMTDILGALPDARLLYDENDPMQLIKNVTPAQHLHFYLDIGRNDELLDQFVFMEQLLRSRGLDYEAHIFPGRHTWEYWSEHFTDSLLFEGKRFDANLKENER